MKNQTYSKDNKRFSRFILLFIISSFFMFTPAKAQVNVSVNISSQALWGPVGYDYVEYYYLPEADVFYYVPTGQFIYLNGGEYVFVNNLPSSYSINLYSTYIVVVNEPKPYLKHNVYFTKYKPYKHSGRNHGSIRDSNDEKYFVVKGHSKHGGSGQKQNGKNSENNNKGNKSQGDFQFNGEKQGGGQKHGGGNKSGGGQNQGGGGHQGGGGGHQGGGSKGKK